MQLDQIRKLENWLRREGSLFRGQTPMQFQQSQEVMERMEDLRKLESQLSSMQLNDVDRELLEKLLGGDPKQDFEGVMRMQSLLEEGGYVLEQGERFDLTAKGVRRVGQLALRKKLRSRWRAWCARCTRAIILASSVFLPAPSNSKPKMCRRQLGTWAI